MIIQNDNILLENFARRNSQFEGKLLALRAASWVVASAYGRSHIEGIVDHLYRALVATVPGCTMWALVGTSAWQPDSRIVRHHGLWGLLKAREIEILGTKSDVCIQQNAGQLKYFGAVRLDRESIPGAVAAMFQERAVYLLAAPGEFELSNYLSIGWTHELSNDVRLISEIGSAGGVIMRRIGLYDEPQEGIQVLGSALIVDRLIAQGV